MKRAAQPVELSVTDGTRHLGSLVPNAGGFEAYGPHGEFIAKCDGVAEARGAVIRRDVENRSTRR
jgi:hypothetical protein